MAETILKIDVHVLLYVACGGFVERNDGCIFSSSAVLRFLLLSLGFVYILGTKFFFVGGWGLSVILLPEPQHGWIFRRDSFIFEDDTSIPSYKNGNEDRAFGCDGIRTQTAA